MSIAPPLADVPPPPPPERSMVRELAAFERLRMSRRRGTWIIRTAFTLFLLLGLYVYFVSYSGEGSWLWPWDNRIELSPGDLARFAEGFVITFFVCQILGILLITPAYIAGAINEERERGTLELLFTSHLNDEEIVQGKLKGRLVHLYAVLLAGVPILALSMLWGGVGMTYIFVGYAVSFLILHMVAKSTMSHAVISPSPDEALVASYLGIPVVAGLSFFAALIPTLGLCCITIPAALFYGPSIFFEMVYAFWIWFLASLWLGRELRRATKRLRVPVEILKQPAKLTTVFREKPAPVEKPSRHSLFIWDQALWWKEIVFDKFFSIGLQVVCVCFVGVFFLVVTLEGILNAGNIDDCVPLLKLAGFPCFFICTLLVGLGAAGCIAWEKQQGTWLGLLMLPYSRQELLRIKLLGSLLRPAAFLVGLVVLYFLGLSTGDWSVISFGQWLMFAGAYFLFLAAGGLALSVHCRTPTQAWLAMCIVLAVTNLSSRIAPWAAWLALSPEWKAWEQPSTHHPWWLVALAYGLLAVLCWWLSLHKICKEHGA